MPWTIETNAADCSGFAVVDEKGKTVGCHKTRREALGHQRALYVNVPEAKKGEPSVNDVHVDSIMKPRRRRVKLPEYLQKDVSALEQKHQALHAQTETPDDAQLYVHHLIVSKIEENGKECDCSCGAWSKPVEAETITVEIDTLQKSENPLLAPIKDLLATAIEGGSKFADVVSILDMGGYVLTVKPKDDEMEIEIEEGELEVESEEDEVEKNSLHSILNTLKDMISEALNPVEKKEVPDSFVPPKAVQEEAQRALNWIKEGHAGANFTDVGRARASQLANGEGVSRQTLARMKSYLARHEVDSQGQGYKVGEAGYPSPGRVAYAAWGGSAAKTWVDKLFRQYDLAKSYGDVETVYKADEKRFTLGPWYIPNQQDAHGEWTDTEELQKALWDYVKSGDRKIRLQHNKNVVAGEWLEVMTWPFSVDVNMNKSDGSANSRSFPQGTVFMGVQWEPWAWELVKKGKLTGYSIGGKAERMMVDLPEEENE